MLFGIYAITTIASFGIDYVYNRSCDNRLNREGYYYYDKSFSETTIRSLAFVFKNLIPAYNIYETVRCVWSYDDEYAKKKKKLIDSKQIYFENRSADEEEYSNNSQNSNTNNSSNQVNVNNNTRVVVNNYDENSNNLIYFDQMETEEQYNFIMDTLNQMSLEQQYDFLRSVRTRLEAINDNVRQSRQTSQSENNSGRQYTRHNI